MTTNRHPWTGKSTTAVNSTHTKKTRTTLGLLCTFAILFSNADLRACLFSFYFTYTVPYLRTFLFSVLIIILHFSIYIIWVFKEAPDRNREIKCNHLDKRRKKVHTSIFLGNFLFLRKTLGFFLFFLSIVNVNLLLLLYCHWCRLKGIEKRQWFFFE